MTPPSLRLVDAGPDDARAVHGLYLATPGYFDVLSIPLPSELEVRTELETAASDPRRRTELIVAGDDGGLGPTVPAGTPVGYLDVTLDYLEPGDATVNLLLVREDLQRRGIGRAAVAELERRLTGRARRVLASVYGRNPHAERFWRSQGFAFAIDAAPVLEWYAKRLDGAPADASGDAVAAGIG